MNLETYAQDAESIAFLVKNSADLSTRNKQLSDALREAREDLSKIRDEAILNDHYYIDQLLAKAISKIDQLLSASERADGKQ